MKMNIKAMSEKHNRWMITCDKPTMDNYQLIIELYASEADPNDKSSLPYLVHKEGLSDKLLSKWWSVNTEVIDLDDEHKNRYGNIYNPTITRLLHRNRLDFKWWLPATAESAELIIREIVRQAYGPNEPIQCEKIDAAYW